ncbi:TPA: DUF4123 domain-containing protein [Pseudomonas aeruginosa]|uniref:DUF4123 domain-containing protein n=1 Tax=Pseudomonas aeruginosa TaxID=287 RepID=UPI000EAF09E1|nr:DUF4123 domain-containing protein [Pseudomonas aeruginosa]MBA4995166.1 DUF4123 domain-containing protein [Pseudomonas aeruginosa]MBL4545484.1 DUF4123 domain-containing protein [Pseudomonas aeruginosa]MDG3600908.1 DUF4123 domain-containing protein [Pseudomonas aeruginosa]MDG3785478.1 DUF4123 domain-containing protein [Pseudomonas aeruginosa]MDG4114925.1 DUF4123 domain-containing protein [Pseudomonas aeruginosa]
MNTLEQWLRKQGELERYLYLVLDSDGQLDERDGLLEGREPHQYGNLYSGTPASSLAAIGPYLFRLDTLDHPVVQALLKSPERHWGWLASCASRDLEPLLRHWRARLVTGARPNQALYRFHDSRVLGRALAHLQPEQWPAFLGPISSACYWLAGQWVDADNPAPGEHAVPDEPAWLVVPTAAETAAGIQFDNARRYLIAEWTEPFAELAGQRDADAWLRAQLELARTWGWRTPEQIRFLLLQRLRATDDALPRSWSPLPDEPPTTHFERVYQEVRFWQGDAPL